jgi:hypothetical protein
MRNDDAKSAPRSVGLGDRFDMRFWKQFDERFDERFDESLLKVERFDETSPHPVESDRLG